MGARRHGISLRVLSQRILIIVFENIVHSHIEKDQQSYFRQTGKVNALPFIHKLERVARNKTIDVFQQVIGDNKQT